MKGNGGEPPGLGPSGGTFFRERVEVASGPRPPRATQSVCMQRGEREPKVGKTTSSRNPRTAGELSPSPLLPLSPVWVREEAKGVCGLGALSSSL